MSNVSLNAGSDLLYVVVLQLAFYPLIGQLTLENEFGEFLTTMGLVNMFGVMAGASVSDFVLKDYADRNLDSLLGPFIRLYNAIFLLVVLTVFCLFYSAITFLHFPYYWSAAVLVVFLAIRTYLVVEFRIAIDYMQIAKVKMSLLLGYSLSLALFYFNVLSNPLNAFILGELLSGIYLFRQTSLCAHGVEFSYETMNNFRKYCGVGFSVLANNIVTYADRIIIATIIGVNVVPYFFATATPGRMVQMSVNSFSNVLLSYLVGTSTESIHTKFVKVVLFTLGFGFFMWGLLIGVSPIFIQLFYANYYQYVEGLVGIVSGGFAAKSVEKVLRPFFIRLLPIKEIAFFDTIFSILYVLLGCVAAIMGGLSGFALGFCALSVAKIVAMIIYLYFIR